MSDLPVDLQDAPGHLSAESRELFQHVVSTGADYDGPARVLLIEFLRQKDVATDARLHLAREGRIFQDRWNQPRCNPWVQIEREAVREMGRLFRLLGWDQAPPPQFTLWETGSHRGK